MSRSIVHSFKPIAHRIWIQARHWSWVACFILLIGLDASIEANQTLAKTQANASPVHASTREPVRTGAAMRANAPAPVSAPATILVMGDSLSAAYGMASAQGWVQLTANQLKHSHPNWRVVNASISGETTAGGLARLPMELRKHQPKIVLIELGANDGLRGLPIAHTRDNLLKMIQRSQQAKAKVLLVGIQLPPNFGRAFTEEFAAMFPALAKQQGTAVLPFLLQPIANDRNAFQPDQIHPTVAAQTKLRDHVAKALLPMLK